MRMHARWTGLVLVPERWSWRAGEDIRISARGMIWVRIGQWRAVGGVKGKGGGGIF